MVRVRLAGRCGEAREPCLSSPVEAAPGRIPRGGRGGTAPVAAGSTIGHVQGRARTALRGYTRCKWGGNGTGPVWPGLSTDGTRRWVGSPPRSRRSRGSRPSQAPHDGSPGAVSRSGPRGLPPRARATASARSRFSRAKSRPAAFGVARTTTSVPAGQLRICSATAWRSRRFTLLRTTALPTALETTKPARAGGGSSASDGAAFDGVACLASPAHAQWTTTPPRAALRPRLNTELKSRLRRMRASIGSTWFTLPTASSSAAKATDGEARERRSGEAASARPVRRSGSCAPCGDER